MIIGMGEGPDLMASSSQSSRYLADLTSGLSCQEVSKLL